MICSSTPKHDGMLHARHAVAHAVEVVAGGGHVAVVVATVVVVVVVVVVVAAAAAAAEVLDSLYVFSNAHLSVSCTRGHSYRDPFRTGLASSRAWRHGVDDAQSHGQPFEKE